MVKVVELFLLQAHLGHKINGNKIHDDEKTTRSNVIKTDKVLEDGQPQRHLCCCGPPARYLPPAANSNKKKAFLPPTFRLPPKNQTRFVFF